MCADHITIADLSAAHELDQVKSIDYDLSAYPKVTDWLHRVIDENPTGSHVASAMRNMAAVTVARERRNARL